MNNDLRNCLKEVSSSLSEFKRMHTVGRTASEDELDLIRRAESSLSEASEIVSELDGIRVNGSRRDNVRRELQQQSEELERSADLMSKYDTRESGDAEMPSTYDTVIYSIEWIDNFL